MLDLQLDRKGTTPRDAATLILVREGATSGQRALEVFCVERNKKSGFMGGAIVFPGGKLDPSDEWPDLHTPPRDGFSAALAIAACRESLEEAAILPVTGAVTDADLEVLRKELAGDPQALRTFLRDRLMLLDLSALHPFARWVTPEAEARRFDARFFVAAAPEGQTGAHDAYETMASFWARPAEVLRRFEAGEVQLAPPTHRTLEILSGFETPADVLAYAKNASLEPVCPKLVAQSGTMALVMPGDPEHTIREATLPGASRYVLRGDRWLPEPAPST